MHRLLRFALATSTVALFGCGGDSILAPVQTVDGEWNGTQNGYSLSLGMVQSGTQVINCSAILASTGGGVTGTCDGTFNYPNLHVTISVPNFLPVQYDGTMSQSEAKIFGKLNGSGLSNVEVDISKK